MQLRTVSARVRFLSLFAALSIGLVACGGGEATAPEGGTADTSASTGETAGDAASGGGSVNIDGSSTVFPIAEAMAEEFMLANAGTNVTVGASGTGGGFKKFCAGETDLSNGSRPIKDEEIEVCKAAGIEFIEVPIAFDGLTVVVNNDNDWATCLSTDQLKAMWAPETEGKVSNWNQVDPSFPDQELVLYGPGTDSGTFDYFTDEVNGEEGASRGDFTASEDDNVIVQGVQSDPGALGYFGYAYYEENKEELKSVQIKNEAGDCVSPSRETIADGSYNPMSRPLFFYVSQKAYGEKPEVKAFVDYMLDPANSKFIAETGYVALPDEILANSKARVETGKTGSDPEAL